MKILEEKVSCQIDNQQFQEGHELDEDYLGDKPHHRLLNDEILSHNDIQIPEKYFFSNHLNTLSFQKCFLLFPRHEKVDAFS